MKTNAEILDEYGKLVAQKVFDSQYIFILNSVKDLSATEGYKELFGAMNVQQKKELEFYTRELLKGTLFDFLKIFEEHENFKLIYEENGRQVDLNKISEMLKAEPIIENGWIEKYSEELRK